MNVVTGIVIAVAILALVVAVLLSRMLKQYDALLGPENISDMSTVLVELKRCANEDHLTSEPINEVPTTLRALTSQGMRVIYTVSAEKDEYRHHISLSCAGQPMAHSAGMTLGAWIGYCLDVPAEKITVPAIMGNGSVRHVHFDLNKEEQSQFLARPVKVVRRSQINQELWKLVMNNRKAIEANSLPTLSASSAQ